MDITCTHSHKHTNMRIVGMTERKSLISTEACTITLDCFAYTTSLYSYTLVSLSETFLQCHSVLFLSLLLLPPTFSCLLSTQHWAATSLGKHVLGQGALPEGTAALVLSGSSPTTTGQRLMWLATGAAEERTLAKLRSVSPERALLKRTFSTAAGPSPLEEGTLPKRTLSISKATPFEKGTLPKRTLPEARSHAHHATKAKGALSHAKTPGRTT